MLSEDICIMPIRMMLSLLLFVIIECNGSESDHIIMETENAHDHIAKLESEPAQTRAYYRIPCSNGLSECIALSDCPEMFYEAARSCSSGDRSIFCGSSDYEPLVCCPRNSVDGDLTCGRNLVHGQLYKGLGAFPFIARVGFKNVNTGNLAYPCTGSIISKRVILTAAHCALAKADGHRLSSVRIGEYDTSKDTDCSLSGFCAPHTINHIISHVIVHPDYVNGQYHHDIALLILRTPLNYTVAAQPICLKPDRTNLLVGKRATIVGWGKLSMSNTRAPEMQSLELPLATWESCLRVYGATGALDSTKSVEGQWLCAGAEGRDACQGFGGAPLVIRENGVHTQIGIMSFGSDNCGAIRVPSVYTSIAHFSQWIKDNVPIE